jgi:hypothetical protein
MSEWMPKILATRVLLRPWGRPGYVISLFSRSLRRDAGRGDGSPKAPFSEVTGCARPYARKCRHSF